jgi:hypothetical protein
VFPRQEPTTHILNLFAERNIPLSEGFHLLPILVGAPAFLNAPLKIGHLLAYGLLSAHKAIDRELSGV